MSVIGIPQYNFLQGGIFNNTTTVLQDVPGMSFEMMPGKSYLVQVSMNMTIKNPEGYRLTWVNVFNPVNPACEFAFISSNTGVDIITPAVDIARVGNFNDGGWAAWSGIFTNNSATLRQTAHLQAAQQQAGANLGVQISTGVLSAIQIN